MRCSVIYEGLMRHSTINRLLLRNSRCKNFITVISVKYVKTKTQLFCLFQHERGKFLRFHHVTFWVGNAKQVSMQMQTLLMFNIVASYVFHYVKYKRMFKNILKIFQDQTEEKWSHDCPTNKSVI